MANMDMEQRLAQLEKSLAERIARLEKQVSQLSEQVEASCARETRWWRTIVGVFQDDPEFEEAMRLGREYRKCLGSTEAAKDTA